MPKSSFVDADTIDADALGATILPFAEGGGEATPASLPHGDTRYDRKKPLGQGGMGTVFEAVDRQFGRTIALKQADATGPAALGRFAVEALVTANLEHPGVTPVYDRGVSADGRPFYTMARVHGRTLDEAIKQATTIEARLKLLPVIVRVAQTLAYAHERGVVHRDIKPENVVVGRHGEAFVLDWGIAKVRGLRTAGDDADAKPVLDEAATKGGATRMGSVLGTPAYMAPEQASGRVDEIDERTDVFALGALLYHVITGQAPYDGTTLKELVERALAASPTPSTTLAPAAPPSVHRVIARAMARAREDRFQTASELASALESTMTDALTEKKSLLVRVAVNVLTVALALALMVAATYVASASSTFRDQGWAAQFTLVTFLCGVGLVGIEWRTRGRYRLSSLILVFAAVTLLMGVGATASGVELTLAALRKADAVGDINLWRNTLAEGAWEALGAIPMVTLYVSAELVLWGVVTRHNASLREG